MEDSLQENLLKAADIILNSDAIIISAGAGMGVDSGLPDFRGNTGFWNAYPAISKLGISFPEMANPRWFETNPKLAWAFYGHRFDLYKKTIPHKGFNILKQLVDQKSGSYFIFTSNVDGHFQKAGFESDRIEEVHGSINHLQCTKPCSSKIWRADYLNITINSDSFEAIGNLPICPNCGAIARPNILMFGDWSWCSQRSDEQSKQFDNYLNIIWNNKIKYAVIELGAGKAVDTVRMKSEYLASHYNASFIRINPRDYHIPDYIKGVSIPSVALDALKNINEMMINH
jgi:NAD-dependent SIR2 family protein deacetylase